MVHLKDAIRHSAFTFVLQSMQLHASSLIECTLQDFNSSGLVMNMNNTSFVLAHVIGKTYKKMIYTGNTSKYLTVNTAKYFTVNTAKYFTVNTAKYFTHHYMSKFCLFIVGICVQLHF